MTGIVSGQYRYLIDKDLGFNKKDLLIIRRPDGLKNRLEDLKTQISRIPWRDLCFQQHQHTRQFHPPKRPIIWQGLLPYIIILHLPFWSAMDLIQPLESP